MPESTESARAAKAEGSSFEPRNKPEGAKCIKQNHTERRADRSFFAFVRRKGKGKQLRSVFLLGRASLEYPKSGDGSSGDYDKNSKQDTVIFFCRDFTGRSSDRRFRSSRNSFCGIGRNGAFRRFNIGSFFSGIGFFVGIFFRVIGTRVIDIFSGISSVGKTGCHFVLHPAEPAYPYLHPRMSVFVFDTALISISVAEIIF